MACASVFATDQELFRVEVTGFPLGQGTSVQASFWNDFQADFERVANLAKDPTVRVRIQPMVDLTEYENRKLDDPLESALLWSRFFAVTFQLEHKGVGKSQAEFVLPDSAKGRGPQYRKATVTVVRVSSYVTQTQLDSTLAAQPKVAPVTIERPITQCQGRPANTYALWIGLGATYNAFDKVVPILQGQVGNRRLRFGLDVSHSLYTVDRTYGNERLDVNYRLVSCYLAFRPILYGTLELLAGWQRTEEYAKTYGKFVRKNEGPEVGLRYAPVRHLAINVVYAPGEVATFGQDQVHWDRNQVRVSVVFSTPIIGGNR